jgi:hypothetical protein
MTEKTLAGFCGVIELHGIIINHFSGGRGIIWRKEGGLFTLTNSHDPGDTRERWKWLQTGAFGIYLRLSFTPTLTLIPLFST